MIISGRTTQNFVVQYKLQTCFSHLLSWSLVVVAFSTRLCGSPAAYCLWWWSLLLVVEMATSQSVAGDFFVCLVNELCPSTTNELDHTKHLALMGCPDHPTNGQRAMKITNKNSAAVRSLHTIFFWGGNEVKIIFLRSPPHKCTQPWRRWKRQKIMDLFSKEIPIFRLGSDNSCVCKEQPTQKSHQSQNNLAVNEIPLY